jgi:hypothetical protein
MSIQIILSKSGKFFHTCLFEQWKENNRKQSAIWQHVSQLKASAFCTC